MKILLYVYGVVAICTFFMFLYVDARIRIVVKEKKDEKGIECNNSFSIIKVLTAILYSAIIAVIPLLNLFILIGIIVNWFEIENRISDRIIDENILKEKRDNEIKELIDKIIDGEKIKIVYHADIDHIKKIIKGDWIDLRAADDYELKKGEFKLISLGVSMKLPDGYEAHVVPRSSTYKNFKILQTNSMGIIDNSYSGTNDIWMFPALATEDTVIHKNDRICQFRIMPIQRNVTFEEVEELESTNRGGFGSTGVN